MMSIDKMNGGSNSFSNGRKRSQRLLLALGAAMISVMLLHKLREGRALGLILQDQDRQILKLQLLLKKERENSREMKRKLENLKAKNFLMRTQKLELSDKLADTQTSAYQLRKMQNEMETVLKEKQNEIKDLSERLKLREAEVREMKQQLEAKPRAAENDTSPHEASESKWVEVQTNIDDGPSKDGGEAASDDQHNADAANFQKNEGSWEVQEQREEHSGEIEMRQESTMEVKEQSIEPTNDQETAAEKETTRDAEGKGHKVHRNSTGNAEKREVTDTSDLQQTDADKAAAGDESTEVQGHSTNHDARREEKEMVSEDEQSGKSANIQEDEAKNENNNDETGASAKGESNSEIQDAAVKEETDDNTESVTKKPDTDNADDNRQTKV